MTTISEFMNAGHKECDELFARAEDAAGDWAKAGVELGLFRREFGRHLAMEEEVLFPAFDEHTGMEGSGPTAMMRAEHAQMRALVEQLVDAVAGRDEKLYLGVAETLIMLIQQHNAKEESMMYPMLDSAVGDRADELIAGCNAVDAGGACALHGGKAA